MRIKNFLYHEEDDDILIMRAGKLDHGVCAVEFCVYIDAAGIVSRQLM